MIFKKGTHKRTKIDILREQQREWEVCQLCFKLNEILKRIKSKQLPKLEPEEAKKIRKRVNI